MQLLAFSSLLWSINTIPCWQGIYYLCFTARQDYFILSRFNRKMGRKWEIHHPTTRKQNFIFLLGLSNLWPEQDSNPQRRVDERFTALKISDHARLEPTAASWRAIYSTKDYWSRGPPCSQGTRFSSVDIKFNNIGSRMQDSIYHMLLNSTKTLKTLLRNFKT